MTARVLRAPLLHFLVLGAMLLGLRVRWDAGRAGGERPRIVIDAGDLGRLREAWAEEHGSPPGPAAEERLVRDAVDEEILFREAVARGFDRSDAAVRERLVRLAGFVGEETSRDRDVLERDARRLGLERGDLVVRRHLVGMMRLAAEWLGPDDRPSGDRLEAYLAAHAADFAEPARVRLTHVYLSADVHGGALEADARALLEALSRGPTPPEEAVSRGDAFIRGATFDATTAELERTFGAQLAAGVEAAPAGRWVGPLRSGYGLHLVWVHGREPGRTPPLAEVRGRVAQAWLRERREQREREAMDEMRSRYLVAVEAH